MNKTKHGETIVPKGAFPERHELNTAWFLNDIGKDVEFLVPADKNHIKTPDIKMEGIFWEIKAPKGNSKYTFQHAFKEALRQSQNIIFDLRRNSMPEDNCINKLKKEFSLSKSIKYLLIITKSKKLLDFKK
ncbi:MAG: hypothetical protein FWF00_07135 [Endomicrobia bacterium]|nr:hypothetical protein [Endomicrobiia bacterium]MCL2507440.1 hypothetical protein [Endomicrobiia bacterium]